MTQSKFKPIPAKTEFKAPFSGTNHSVKKWLQSLPISNDYSSCNQIFNSLQALDDLNLTTKTKVAILQTIFEHLEILVKRLEISYIDASVPLSDKAKNNVELVVWTYAELSTKFFHCVENKPQHLSLNNDANCLYYSLLNLSRSLLHCSLVYKQAFSGFWNLCYDLFIKADQLRVLDRKIRIESKKPSTFFAEFKHILVFNECQLNQFRPREIRTIYGFLNRYIEHAVLTNIIQKEHAKFFSAIDLGNDQATIELKDLPSGTQSNILYLAVHNIASSIYQETQEQTTSNNTLTGIDQALSLKLIKSLSKSYKRQFTRIKENKLEQGIIGLNNLLNYLCDNENDTQQPRQIKQFDPRITGSWSFPDMDLLPLGDEQVLLMHESKKQDIQGDDTLKKIFAANRNLSNVSIWDPQNNSQQAEGEDVFIGDFEILDSSIHGYGIQIDDDHQIQAKVGEVVGIMNTSGQGTEIGIICRISKPASDLTKLGIKLIGFDCKPVKIFVPNHEKTATRALLIPGNAKTDKHDSLVVYSSHFTPGDFITLQNGNKKSHCRLKKMLHNTSAISHVELFYPNYK